MITAIENVVQPLCEATAGIFEPLSPHEWDWLEVGVNDDVDKFLIRGRTYTKVRAGACKWCNLPEDQHWSGGHKYQETEVAFVQDGVSYGESGMAPSGEFNKLIERIPEKRLHSKQENEWACATTDFTALLIKSLWPADRIRWRSENAHLMYSYLTARFSSQAAAAKIAAEYKVNKTVPALPADFIEHPDYPLLGFQRVPTAMFAFRESAALFMEQGCGKTPTTIARIMLEAQRKFRGQTKGVPAGMYRVLIVCPNQVRYNWQMEFEKFATLPGKVTVLRGGQLARGKKLIDAVRAEPDCCWSAVIIGYDTVNSMLDHLKLVKFDLAVCDESHMIKSARALRSQVLRRLRDEGQIRQRMILTGTPIANTLMDLWNQLEFLGQGLSGFHAFSAFKSFHGKWVRGIGGTVIEKLVGLKNVPLIQERLARLAFMITKEEAGLELPDLTELPLEVEMSPQQAEYYVKVRDQLAIEIQNDKDAAEKEGRKLQVSHVLTKLLRLSQITSGFIRWDDVIDGEGNVVKEGFVEPIPGENPKLEALIEKLKEEDRDPRAKSIIWSCWKSSIVMIAERLEEEGIKFVEYWGEVSQAQREKAVWEFNNNPEVKVFLGNPSCAGAGLNLLGYNPNDPDADDTYCDWELVYDQGWSAVLRAQALARAHRKGTRYPVQVFDFIVPGTIDEEIRNRVTKKIEMANNIQDLSNLLDTILGYKIED
jgi:SNF2 family DNA or RNA helicase